MQLTNQQQLILKKGIENEYITVGPEDYADCEYLHKEGLLELGFVVPGNRHYWLTTMGRVTVNQGE
jgi:hypothetical protein